MPGLLRTWLLVVATTFAVLSLSAGRLIAWHLHRKTRTRRSLILAQAKHDQEQFQARQRVAPPPEDPDWVSVERNPSNTACNGSQAPEDWRGIIGFLHPFCNAGGGGERVLWAAIKATQQRWPNAICAVYTGDHNALKDNILERVNQRFNIHLHPPTVVFLYLDTRHWVLSTTWPHFTLLGQSLGSLLMAYNAFALLVPDLFIDTMGYSFALALCTFLFGPSIPTAAYVHYPTISTDMLNSLSTPNPTHGLNAGTGTGLKGATKRLYWRAYAWLYCLSGRNVDVVMTNSSWTQAHIQSLWGPKRTRRGKCWPIEAVFPPVAVEELEERIELDGPRARKRDRIILYVAQFRPEKNHEMVLKAFARMMHKNQGEPAGKQMEDAKLVLIGSVRDDTDSKKVYSLRLLARDLNIDPLVTFACDAPWSDVLDYLATSWVGVNAMWNEHFGIGVVEYQAAGLVCVVNDSGGPKADVVVEVGGERTGFHASTEAEYAEGFTKALMMGDEETKAMRRRARVSSRRFTEKAFAERWVVQLERLIKLQRDVKN
ncbi:asparagine-linked glycosylation protein [Puttea exsequens]|nr:asparagine-linked glycosylation protein [Puttea exsequens]